MRTVLLSQRVVECCSLDFSSTSAPVLHTSRAFSAIHSVRRDFSIPERTRHRSHPLGDTRIQSTAPLLSYPAVRRDFFFFFFASKCHEESSRDSTFSTTLDHSRSRLAHSWTSLVLNTSRSAAFVSTSPRSRLRAPMSRWRVLAGIGLPHRAASGSSLLGPLTSTSTRRLVCKIPIFVAEHRRRM
jgi:hypothetical protein